MQKIRKPLLVAAAAAGIAAAPFAAQADSLVVVQGAPAVGAASDTYVDPATGTVTTTTVTTTTTGPLVGNTMDLVDPIAWLEEKGYHSAERVPGVTLESEMAFHVANRMGEPVKLIVDKRSGEITRETYLRKLDKPSKQ